MNDKLACSEATYAVIGCAQAVYAALGPGFPEPVSLAVRRVVL